MFGDLTLTDLLTRRAGLSASAEILVQFVAYENSLSPTYRFIGKLQTRGL